MIKTIRSSFIIIVLDLFVLICIKKHIQNIHNLFYFIKQRIEKWVNSIAIHIIGFKKKTHKSEVKNKFLTPSKMTTLQLLFNQFDCFGWIPSIHGSLNLKLLVEPKDIMGDVDKYLIHFKGLNEQHYLVASSLITVGGKLNNNYISTFRYIFTGEIKNQEFYKDYLNRTSLDLGLMSYLMEEGILLGHLTLLPKENRRLSNLEINLLTSIIELNESNNFLRKSNNNFSVTQSNKQKNYFEHIKETILSIEESTENEFPRFCFEVFVTQDGMLLLKDVTNIKYNSYYTYDDNILSLLFANAAEYIKRIFHSHQYHNDENFLPVTNLHAVESMKAINFRKIFKYQLDGFFIPVIRNIKNSSYLLFPYGIILYARSYINFFEANKLVEDYLINNARDKCDMIEREIQISKRDLIKEVSLKTALLTLFVAFLQLMSSYIKMPELKFCITNNIFSIQLFVLITMIVFLFYIIPKTKYLASLFRLKSRKHCIFLRNSNLQKGKLSKWYVLYILCKKITSGLGEKKKLLLKIIALLLCLVVLCFIERDLFHSFIISFSN